jgi:hypothetical protein
VSPQGPEGRGALVDGRGCLTPAGFAALTRAPVGRAPADLAAHLASCSRCQERMLAGGTSAGRPSSTPSRRRPPRLWLGLALAFAALLLAVAALILAGRMR